MQKINLKKNPQLLPISVMVDKFINDELEKLMKKYNKSKSEVVRDIMRDLFKEK